jgi:hypothetical protein
MDGGGRKSIDRPGSAFAAVPARKLREMEGASRDDTQDWLLPAGSAPPLISELEHRVDEAIAIARASEAAAIAIGDAAMRSAEQARRAADLAERASERVAFWPSTESGAAGEPVAEGPAGNGNGEEDRDEALARFISHADLVRARLVRLQG